MCWRSQSTIGLTRAAGLDGGAVMVHGREDRQARGSGMGLQQGVEGPAFGQLAEVQHLWDALLSREEAKGGIEDFRRALRTDQRCRKARVFIGVEAEGVEEDALAQARLAKWKKPDKSLVGGIADDKQAQALAPLEMAFGGA